MSATNIKSGEEAAPSKQMVTPPQTMEIEDALGRKIKVKRVTALESYRLMKMLGPMIAQNGTALQFAMQASSVVSIDGEAVPPVSNDREVEAVFQRLDFEGIIAVQKALALIGEVDSGNVVDSAKN